ncbi:undecaprenyl-phosphate glucose phosphotransferase [Epilithonimonas hispanica]|uniref:Undecaprenyl-phosphate glucose phosphotransferase n=1 Tax=Epilithonimonas hispanica TaxID=358687 RepID=A0A3D9D5J3_9FLAO|nr:undecaprenyl-phosphate glucose phosphotransferase [Epilithonimonas hispanica]REC73259.1 undecaprenyl-phosphate glucose phosphotransferase [Epilithonimonas hispanica]
MPLYFFKKLANYLLLVDYIIVNISFLLGICIFINPFEFYVIKADYKTQLLILNFSWYIISKLVKLYSETYYKDSVKQFSSLFTALSIFIVFFFFYNTLIYSESISIWFTVKYLFSVISMMVLVRIVVFLIRRKYRIKISRKLNTVNTILIGKNNFSKTILSNDEIRASMGIRGFYSLESTAEKGKYLGDINKLFDDLENEKIDNIILCDDSIDEDLYNEILHVAEHKMLRIYIVPDFKYISMGPHSFDIIQGVPFLKLMKEPLTNPENQFLKRFFDVVFSLLVIVFILSWLIPIVALIIKLESKGSVFFLQKRSGVKNEPFNCIKFRSMTVNSHSDVKMAKKGDARITKFGKFIRKTSIDELPQFINVLIGNMSVVGPRPHMLSQTNQYSKITRKYMLRHIVKPGITGWAQVMGSRGEIFSDRDMEKRIEKDIWYIQNWSFFLDLKIVFLTFYNIVKGDEQAY